MATVKTDEDSESADGDDDYKYIDNNIDAETSKQIVKMVFNKPIATTPISLLIESLVKNLSKMIERDEQRAKKIYTIICQKLFDMKLIDESYQMNEFEGIRSQYQKALFHLVNVARNCEDPIRIQSANNFDGDWSHYQREFDEIEYIAGGGFGRVFRVRHKLDGSEYAIKKIHIRSNGIRAVRNYLSEVKTFASLNHSNIVQYKAAWLELGIPNATTTTTNNTNPTIEIIDDASSSDQSSSFDSDSDIDDNCQNNSDSYENGDNYFHFQRSSRDYVTDTSDIHIGNDGITVAHHNYHSHFESFTNSSLIQPIDVETNTEFTVEFESYKSKHESFNNNYNNHHHSTSRNMSVYRGAGQIARRQRSRNSISEGGKALCKFNIDEVHRWEQQDQGHQRAAHKWATLYIQMSLCQITLKQWLEKRNETEHLAKKTAGSALVCVKSEQIRRDTILEILSQMLRGLEYIHSKGIVHHDIKPSNIFIQFDNSINSDKKACLCVQLGDFGLACPLQNAQHPLAFGTKLYAAPEQLYGKCDPKSDMYSLGIVLLELVESFNTDMERVHHIEELRKGHLGSHVTAQEPQLAQIISQLVVRSTNQRPNATELLNRLVKPIDESEEIQNLRLQLEQKDTEITRLKEMLKNAGIDA